MTHSVNDIQQKDSQHNKTAIIINVFRLNVVMLKVIMLSVIKLNVVGAQIGVQISNLFILVFVKFPPLRALMLSNVSLGTLPTKLDVFKSDFV